MRDSDIDSLTADAAQVTVDSSSDPRTALAEAWSTALTTDEAVRNLAERGVLLVTEAERKEWIRMLGALLGHHHRQFLVSRENCLACSAFPVTYERLRAALSERQESAAVEGPEEPDDGSQYVAPVPGNWR
jgi:hypothetical protein